MHRRLTALEAGADAGAGAGLLTAHAETAGATLWEKGIGIGRAEVRSGGRRD